MLPAVREEGTRLGLAAVGVASAVDGVRQVYEWATSVICAAISYLPPEQVSPESEPHGLIARIARGADYHQVLRGKLHELAKAILMRHPSARLEICVDTNPLPERKLAVLSGIGWRGRNGCVYVEGCGSWVALGEIVTDLPLEDPTAHQLEDRCGDCRRCIDACPTKAIREPHRIDRGRCLSALTQASGSIHDYLRPTMGNRIYGCDVCQEVCPQNAGTVATNPEFAGQVFPGAFPGILPLIEMTPSYYDAVVKGTSIGWIRRNRIRRNAAIAAGNLKCESALTALTPLLSDENPMLRETAEWAIKEIEGSASKRK